ncbi:hypothetical protein ACH4UT_15250 [Streptomyces sp. NPDC020799]|uniref:hypothetical protein n=1 Tax=unclassified Streptomyces TaxID=2593676 RepID=UPI0033DBB2BE
MSKRQKGRRHRKVNRTPRPRAMAAPPRPAAVVVPELGRHMARTWEGLRTYGAAGASLEELAEAVGYQARTVLKHVTGFADQGLAEARGDRWYARTG